MNQALDKKITLSVHQPAYLPWLGYFQKIAKADIFIFLDTVQFERASFINRNTIKTPQGASWLTIPVQVKGHRNSTLRDTLIDDTQPWRSKHLKAISLNYCHAPHFKACFPKLEGLLSIPESNLAELCWHQLQFWLTELQIHTRVVRSSALPIMSKKSELMLDLCKHFGADHYFSGALGKDYLDEKSFSTSGITVEYQEFQHPVYPQLWGKFEPYMSIIDLWMNCGSDARNYFKEKCDGF